MPAESLKQYAYAGSPGFFCGASMVLSRIGLAGRSLPFDGRISAWDGVLNLACSSPEVSESL